VCFLFFSLTMLLLSFNWNSYKKINHRYLILERPKDSSLIGESEYFPLPQPRYDGYHLVDQEDLLDLSYGNDGELLADGNTQCHTSHSQESLEYLTRILAVKDVIQNKGPSREQHEEVRNVNFHHLLF